MKLVPYISIDSGAEEAMEYYKELLDGEIVYIMRYGDGPEEMLTDSSVKDKILHATMMYGDDQLLYFCDNLEEPLGPGNVSINLMIQSEEEIKRVYEFLFRDAQKITQPLQDTFWNAKFASLIDKYGVYWSMNYDMDTGEK